MSSHFVKRREPPPGLSSFTKIRLGWISSDQVALVRPGETRHVVLSPLEKRGKIFAIKIPLDSGLYYLVENRQPIGFDLVLPDSGVLVLRMAPDAMEGAGTVQVMDADPDSPHFAHATFRPDKAGRLRFVDRENRIAVVPLTLHEENMEILVAVNNGPDRFSTIFIHYARFDTACIRGCRDRVPLIMRIAGG